MAHLMHGHLTQDLGVIPIVTIAEAEAVGAGDVDQPDAGQRQSPHICAGCGTQSA